ncbi:antirestriction protein ArdA [Paludibacter sp. 221]|uniref:antirestriction protein ArdA n=1 Tax=Paludibacter sp. 221 TaxID=2302939 RepID=UPI0013D54BC9|nr:antirestriction protein ArdA [Paludibacter sp. 221]NDV46243.1 antirestriction protein ArdA [Paludibacter sp. 221]
MTNFSTLQDARIYVGTYAKYNNGSIFGKWLDLSDYSDKEEFEEACCELHKDEEDPELMFQDWENIPSELISESWLSDDFFEIRDAVDDLSEIEKEAFQVFLKIYSFSWSDAVYLIGKFINSFQGSYNSKEDFAQELFDECYLHEVPEKIRYYIDYEAFARDLFLDGYSYGSGFVFNDNF